MFNSHSTADDKWGTERLMDDLTPHSYLMDNYKSGNNFSSLNHYSSVMGCILDR